jgi:1,4-alpha-glucan branching enzyme
MPTHTDLSADDIERLIRAEHWDPFAILGPHRIERDGIPALAVRVLSPQAAGITVEPEVPAWPHVRMARIHPAGLYEAVYPNCPEPSPYPAENEGSGWQDHPGP